MELSNNYVILILFLIVFLSIIIHLQKAKDYETEGFNVAATARKIGQSIINPIANGLKKTVAKVAGGITSLVRTVGNGIKQIASVKNGLLGMIKQIGDFFKKVIMVIPRIGIVIYNGIIKPIGGFFVALGNTFVQIALILWKIIQKIISLPNCMPVYMYHGGKAAGNTMYKRIIPGPIRWIISIMFMVITLPLYYFMILPLELVLNIFGSSIVKPFNDLFKTDCYNFNVKDNVKSMTGGFVGAAKNFSKSFGNMNFASIWR